MENEDKNQLLFNASVGYLDEHINQIQEMLAYGLNLPVQEIKISFPSLKNFYSTNNLVKSSWAIYIQDGKMPKLLYTGNFLIQGGNFSLRSNKSPFGADALSSLTSIANTFSYEASFFKQNWTCDLNLFDDNSDKLKFSVKEYQEFLKILNILKTKWLLHVSEEGNFDLVIIEFSEPSDQLFFVDLENIDSLATRIKTYFKPISQKALSRFRSLSLNTEFEGKFYNLQPGTWLRDDVLIEIEKYYYEKFFNGQKIVMQIETQDPGFTNPFKVQVLRPT